MAKLSEILNICSFTGIKVCVNIYGLLNHGIKTKLISRLTDGNDDWELVDSFRNTIFHKRQAYSS